MAIEKLKSGKTQLPDRAGLASPDLNQPDKNPSKFCGGQNVSEVYSQASNAVNADFAWAPWFAFVNDNYNKQIEALLGGKFTPKQALDAWQNEMPQERQRRWL
jgi:multiple sugar transport system substrate-binding protein